jgi:ATP-dependent Clp protease ATP-binding subunit ClpC
MAKAYPKFKDILIKMSPHINKGVKEIKAGSSSPAEMVFGGVTRFVTDEVAQNVINDKHFKILGREDVVERLLLVLSRYKQQNAVLVGSKGAGKTSTIDSLAEKIVLGLVSQNEVTEFLHESIVLQTSTGKISGLAKTDKPAGQAQAMEEFFRSVKEVQEKVGRRMIIFIDEIHTLTNAQIESIKPILDSSNGGILLVGASTSPELRTAFKHNEAFLRRIQQVAVREFSEEEILEIFRNSWLQTFEKRHGDIVIDEKVMRLIIRKATMVYPDKGVLDASFILTDDLLTFLRYKANDKSQAKEVTPTEVYAFIQREIGLPIDPSKTKELEAYRANLSEALKGEVLENERMIDEVLDLWIDLLKNESPRGIRVAAILGRSGTGKSELALQLAIRALGSKERLFVIDGNRYKDANDIKLGIIFGVPGGVSFGQFSSGTLMEWLDDPSKGKHAGIIVINEADKANELFWINFMEFFDTGRIQGGDNKTRIANKHLVILTSNRGDKVLFPKDLEKMAEDKIRERVYGISEEEIRSLLEEKISETDVNNLPDSIVNRIDLFTVSNLVTPRVAKIIAQKIISYISREHEKSHGVR